MRTGIQLIAIERKEQIEKHGFDLEHDSFESAFQLSSAAAMLIARSQNKYFEDHNHHDDLGPVARFQIREIGEPEKWSEQWPWTNFDKRDTTGIIESLIKAGALIAAEIDRLNDLNDNDS